MQRALKNARIFELASDVYVLFVTSCRIYVSCTGVDALNNSRTLQKIKREAARLVTGLTRYVSLKNLYKECGWTTLSQRRPQHKLSFMYNVNTGMVLSYIQDFIHPLVYEISDYPLRNNRHISVSFNQTITQKSCIPSSIRLWNSLEDNFKNLSTLG